MKCISYGIQSIVESIMIISFRLSLLVVFYCGNNLVKQSFFDKKNFQIYVVRSFSFLLLVVKKRMLFNVTKENMFLCIPA